MKTWNFQYCVSPTHYNFWGIPALCLRGQSSSVSGKVYGKWVGSPRIQVWANCEQIVSKLTDQQFPNHPHFPLTLPVTHMLIHITSNLGIFVLVPTTGRKEHTIFHFSWKEWLPFIYPETALLKFQWFSPGQAPWGVWVWWISLCAPRFHIHNFKKCDTRPSHSLFAGPTCAHFSVISLPLDFHCLSLVLFSFLNWNRNFTHSSIFHSVFLSHSTLMIYFYAFKIIFSQFISGFCVCFLGGGWSQLAIWTNIFV